jgi:hypothetical protein
MAGNDRRRQQRHSVELPIELESGGSMVLLNSHDISAGGAFFGSAIPHAVGTKVKVRFTLPGDDRAVTCEGEVVTTRGQKLGMGVKFLGLSSSDARKVSRFAEAVAAPSGAKGSKS